MPNTITLRDKVADESILLENDLFLPEVRKILDPFDGEVLFVQGFTLNNFSLHVGEYVNARKAEKGKYCLELKDAADIWMNGKDLQVGSSNGMPFNYNGCSIARIVSPSKEVLYKNEEDVKEWYEHFHRWQQQPRELLDEKFFFQNGMIENLLKTYNLEIRWG